MGTKHMIKTPTHFADVLYNEVLQKICLNLHLLDKQFDDFCIVVFFQEKENLLLLKDDDVDLKCYLFLVVFLLICVLSCSLHQMLILQTSLYWYQSLLRRISSMWFQKIRS